jgi:streptogramin lyase
MNNLDYRFLYFDVLDYTNSHTTSSYTLPITPFTFIPKFNSGDHKPVSNTRILWDFGDGTTSRDITATHFYKTPGTYSVKCYFYGASGIGNESSFCQNLLVRDYISDTIVLSATNNAIIRASHYENPFIISRFNSWQTYNSLSSQGTSITLHASGNFAPMLDIEAYNNDKYAHLKPSSRFVVIEFNPILSSYEAIPVNEIFTKNNKDIYVRLDSNKNIVLCNQYEIGSVLAGTSGQCTVYFTDDYSKPPIDNIIPPTYIAISLNFKDFYDNNNDYNLNSKYAVLNNVYTVTYSPRIYPQNKIGCATFSTNGIDSDGSFEIDRFNIGKNKFVGQKIPFIAKIKDEDNFPCKTWPKLTLKKENQFLTSNSIKFYLKNTDTNTIVPNAFDIYEDYGEFSDYEKLGFFKGYIVPKIPIKNAAICCDFATNETIFNTANTEYVIATNPQSTYIYKIDLAYSIKENLIDENNVRKTLFNTNTLSGMYASIIVTRFTGSDLIYEYWVVDSDKNQVAKIDIDSNNIKTINLPLSASPSFLAADSVGDIWVTLYDSVSVCKISNEGNILFYATPNSTNQDYTNNSFYIPQGGAAGSNSILPALVDTDTQNNAWVAYNYTLSSFVCVFDTNGSLLHRTNIQKPYMAYGILCTKNGITWILLKNSNDRNYDALLKINQSNKEETIFNFNHRLWDFTNDIDGNLWFIGNKNDVLKFSTSENKISIYASLPSNNGISIDCNFSGIASTTQKDLFIFDNIQREIKILKNYDLTGNPTSDIKRIKLDDVNTSGFYQNIINARGDVTGFKFSDKYMTNAFSTNKTGCSSNTFSIYPLSGGANIAKLNENFDMHAQVKNLAFQEILRDSNDLFNDFFKNTLGTIDDNPNTLGKKLYEKIANYVDNNSFIDTCNIEKLNALHKMLNENLYIFNTYNFPSNITRLIDLFSIKLSKLKGSRNQYNENFDTKGYTPNGLYGKNLGDELNFFTATLTGGEDGFVVAYERFSKTYTLCNTNLINVNYIDPVQKIYPLSSYSVSWGWPLVLPPQYDAMDMPKYYTFYKHISTPSLEQLEGIINWSDKFTTISESISSYSDWWDIAENIITRELMMGLELLSSNS